MVVIVVLWDHIQIMQADWNALRVHKTKRHNTIQHWTDGNASVLREHMRRTQERVWIALSTCIKTKLVRKLVSHVKTSTSYAIQINIQRRVTKQLTTDSVQSAIALLDKVNKVIVGV